LTTKQRNREKLTSEESNKTDCSPTAPGVKHTGLHNPRPFFQTLFASYQPPPTFCAPQCPQVGATHFPPCGPPLFPPPPSFCCFPQGLCGTKTVPPGRMVFSPHRPAPKWGGRSPTTTAKGSPFVEPVFKFGKIGTPGRNLPNWGPLPGLPTLNPGNGSFFFQSTAQWF